MAYTPLRIHIPKPCHENWDGMTAVPGTPARHCDSCEKNVTDFTGFSDGQLHAYVRENRGKLCGRFRPDQLGRPVRANEKPGINPLKIAAAAAGLMAATTSCATPDNEITLGDLMPIEVQENNTHNLTVPWTGEIALVEDQDINMVGGFSSIPAPPPYMCVEPPTPETPPSPTGDSIATITPTDLPDYDGMIMGELIAHYPEPTGWDKVTDTLKTWRDSVDIKKP